MALINPTKKKRKILTPKGSDQTGSVTKPKVIKPVKPVLGTQEAPKQFGEAKVGETQFISSKQEDVDAAQAKADREKLTQSKEGLAQLTKQETAARFKQEGLDIIKDAEALQATRDDQNQTRISQQLKRKKEEATAFAKESAIRTQSQQAQLDSSFVEGRGGVQTSSVGFAKGVVSRQLEERSATNRRKFEASMESIRSAETQLSQAIEEKSLNKRKDAIDAFREAKLSMEKTQKAIEEDEFEQTRNTLNFAKKLGALANSSDESLIEMAESTGVPLALWQGAREADKQALSAKGLDQIKARQEATMRQLEIESFADSKMSPELRLIRERQSLVDGGATQSTIDAFDNKAGLSPNMKVIKGEGNTFFGYTPDGQFINLTPGASDSFYPTGELKQAEFAGRKVTLDSSALATVAEINSQLVSTGLGEMVIYSSTRDQASTIASMVTEYNQDNPDSIIEVSPGDLSSLNAAAITLSNRGRPVAQVGHSLHEQGRAIDIPGGKIATYKPLLQANGWQQSTDPNDSGHFNFIGTEKPRQPEPVLKTKEQADNWNFGKRTQQGNLTLRQLEDEFIFDKVGVKTVGEDIGQFDIEEAIDEFTISFGGLNLEFDLLGFDDLSVKVPNVWKNVNEQKYDQATSNFLNAVLRKESGAAISTGEFKSGEAQYFPAPGDTLETIKQKRRNRQLVVDNLFQSSGNSKLQPQALSKLQSINLADIASKQQREDASTLLQVSDPSQQLNANDIPLPINRGQE